MLKQFQNGDQKSAGQSNLSIIINYDFWPILQVWAPKSIYLSGMFLLSCYQTLI
jgi:hypothetical protein